MHIKLADTAPNEILNKMISYFSKIHVLLFVKNKAANCRSLRFILLTIYPQNDFKKILVLMTSKLLNSAFKISFLTILSN